MRISEMFRDNLKAALKAHKEKTGENLRRLCEIHFGNDESKYKWLRKLCSEGSPFKREGTKNHPELRKLHGILNLPWPSLWEEPRHIGAELLERLTRMLASDRGADVEKAVAEVLDQLEYGAAAETLLAQLEAQHPDLHQCVIENYDLDEVKRNIAAGISQDGFEAVWLYVLDFFTNAKNAKPTAVVEEPTPASPMVPNADALMRFGMSQKDDDEATWWEEYALGFDNEEAAFTSLPQKWLEYSETENDPSVAGFWKSWIPIQNLLKQSAPVVELSPKDKLLAAIQNHPDWDRFVEKIGSVDGAIARAQSAIISTDKFLAENSPNYAGRWAEKLILKELGK